MRNIIMFTLGFVFLSTTVISQKLPSSDLLDVRGKTLYFEKLKTENIFFLVASTTCGYCIKDMAYYNSLVNKYSKLTDFVFIALMEGDANKISNFKKNNVFLNDKWIVIPSAGNYYSKIWRKGLFPEYLVFKKGRLSKSFAFSNIHTIKKIKKYFRKNISVLKETM